MSAISSLTGSPASTKNEVPSPRSAAMHAAPVKPPTKSKPRKRVNTAEKRHQHNAIERQRRETLNGKFISLARLVPALASHRRPSKSAIVNGSIAHLTLQRQQRLLAARLLRQLCAERDQLVKENNEWRKAAGYAAKDTTSAWSDEMEEVCSVEKEEFGNFASMDVNDNDNDNDDDESADVYEPMSAPVFQNAPIVAPQGSNDGDLFAQAHAQALFADMPTANKFMPTAGVNGLNWSSDFVGSAMSAAQANNNGYAMPFGAFMPESFDHSSSESPANSVPAVLTPPTTEHVFTQTPSPRSSSSVLVEDVKAAPAGQVPSQVNAWTAAQLLAMQPQLQHAALQRQAAAAAQMNMGMFNGMFAQHQAANAAPYSASAAAAAAGPEALTQSLLTMFAQRDAASTGHGFPAGPQRAHTTPAPAGLNPTTADLDNVFRFSLNHGFQYGLQSA